jgi:CPA2 family monovalent cation:H+ antiporter-2
MLFDPSVLVDRPLHVLGVVAIILLGNSIPAATLVLVFKYPLNTALTIAASLAQIGEFSFILAGLGKSIGLLPAEGVNLILAGALISIALNSFVFTAISPFRRWILDRSALARRLEVNLDPYAELPMSTERKYLEGQVVLVGYGRVGRRIAKALDERGIPYVVAEQNREVVEDLRKNGRAAVSGNAGDPAVLIQAHIANAAMLVVATPDTINVRQMAETARTLNPAIEIILRTHNEEESVLLHNEGIGSVFFGEEELAKGMTSHVLTALLRPVELRRYILIKKNRSSAISRTICFQHESSFKNRRCNSITSAFFLSFNLDDLKHTFRIKITFCLDIHTIHILAAIFPSCCRQICI